MKRKGLLCLLALLLFFAGFMLIGGHLSADSPTSKVGAQSVVSARPQTISLASAIPAGQEEASSATQAHLTFVSGSQHSLFLAATPLFASNPGTRHVSNAVLLPAIARLIGLSHLVLRE